MLRVETALIESTVICEGIPWEQGKTRSFEDEFVLNGICTKRDSLKSNYLIRIRAMP